MTTAFRSLITVALPVLLLTGAVGMALADGPARTVTLTFVGDVMLGRSVAPVAAADPEGLFRDVRHILRASDLAFGNLESALTHRPHSSANPNDLTADPATAPLLAAAGFDVMSLANNHTGDAGPEGLLDTIEAVETTGMATVGAGRDRATAPAPLLWDVAGIRITVLAFDATGTPGPSAWDVGLAEAAVRNAARDSDLVIVSTHGGVEYLPEADPHMTAITEHLVTWGVDIVWGHGPHVVHPVSADGAVVATSLGNFLFDQRGPATGVGAVLQVMASGAGVIAFRTGSTSHHDLRAHFTGWDLPTGDAVLFDGEWWNLTRTPTIETAARHDAPYFPWGTVVASALGRVIGEEDELVVSFRHRPGPHPVRDGLQDIRWTDADGQSAHLGIYAADDMTPLWVAGMLPAPVAELAACDGSVALAYASLDDPTVTATGAAVWRPTGLDASVRLPGPGTVGCADVNGDGVTEPVILHRVPLTQGTS